eukprot:TRINITY_DN64066_c0_g1_i1.p1 TRINITY_DN64066_c0_g1~~TRINITY_DN64066_c0_g1_i1.p1  ORF type:complete len:527 (-),score=93.37 TRINITY_DN64066_c0_g1_i1:146-1726(-)
MSSGRTCHMSRRRSLSCPSRCAVAASLAVVGHWHAEPLRTAATGQCFLPAGGGGRRPRLLETRRALHDLPRTAARYSGYAAPAAEGGDEDAGKERDVKANGATRRQRGDVRGFSTPLETWEATGVRFQAAHVNMNGDKELPKVMSYDSKDLLLGWGFLSVLVSPARVGTVFGDVQFLTKGVILLGIFLFTRYIGTDGIPLKDVARYAREFSDFTSFLNGSLSFLLGLYISSTLSRWWAVRDRCVGEHARAIDDLCMLAAVICSTDSERDRYLRETVRRYGLLASAMLYKQARGEENMMGDMEEIELLTAAERQELKMCTDKVQVIWSWMTHLWYKLFMVKRVPEFLNAAFVMQKLLEGRDAARKASYYTETQLPLAYVQLLAFVVNVALVLNAISAGVSGSADPGLWVTDFIAAMRLLFFFFVFAGLMAVGAQLESPIAGGDSIDFPELAYQERLSSETAMLIREPLAATIDSWIMEPQKESPKRGPPNNGEAPLMDSFAETKSQAEAGSGYNQMDFPEEEPASIP